MQLHLIQVRKEDLRILDKTDKTHEDLARLNSQYDNTRITLTFGSKPNIENNLLKAKKEMKLTFNNKVRTTRYTQYTPQNTPPISINSLLFHFL